MRVEYQIVVLLFLHWVGDFLFQNEWMAYGKSKSWLPLITHVGVYVAPFFVVGIIVYLIQDINVAPDRFTGVFIPYYVRVLCFTLITFACHLITDYITSRWTSSLRERNKYYGFPAFFSVIGIDQWIHGAQLIVTFVFVNSI